MALINLYVATNFPFVTNVQVSQDSINSLVGLLLPRIVKVIKPFGCKIPDGREKLGHLQGRVIIYCEVDGQTNLTSLVLRSTRELTAFNAWVSGNCNLPVAELTRMKMLDSNLEWILDQE